MIKISRRAYFIILIALGLICLSSQGLEAAMTGENQVNRDIYPDEDLSQEKVKPAPEVTVKPEYAPAQVIVKFKKDAGEQVRRMLNSELVLANSITGLNSVDVLNQKLKVKEISPVFKDLYAMMKKTGKDAATLSKEIDAKFSQRAKRAPVGASIPDLENVYLFKAESDQDVLEMAAEYRKDPAIEYAEPNYIMKINMLPNDPYYHSSGSWGQDYDDLWGLKKIQADRAWEISQGKGVLVAVVDTGIDYNHEDIAENVWINQKEIPDNGIDDDNNGFIDDVKGWDFAGSNVKKSGPDSDPADGLGHGTHCAGIIAAIGNNEKGIIGVAPKARVMAVKGLDDYGVGSVVGLARAIKYAVDNGSDVLSNSWGGWGSSRTLENIMNYAYRKGCVIVAAAGNEDSDTIYYTPASIPCVIAVGSISHNDEKSNFSNWGLRVDISAPGGDSKSGDVGIRPWRNILSLRAESTDMYKDRVSIVGKNYYRARGTSMACPYVAGTAALEISRHPRFSNEEVRNALTFLCNDISAIGDNKDYDIRGRLNAYKAVTSDIPIDISAYITSPTSRRTISRNCSLTVEGTAAGRDFGSYELRLGYTYNVITRSLLKETKWQWKEYKSNAPVKDGVLGVFDLPDYVDRIKIALFVYDSQSKFRRVALTDEIKVCISYSPVKQGWPIHIPHAIQNGEINTIDLDRDNRRELVFSDYARLPGLIYAIVLGADGNLCPGTWPAYINTSSPNTITFNLHHLVIMNHNNPAQASKIISAFESSGICSINSDGTMPPGWPLYFDDPSQRFYIDDIVSADLDNDGNDELLVYYQQGLLKPTHCLLLALKQDALSLRPTLLWSIPIPEAGKLMVGDFVPAREGLECCLVTYFNKQSRKAVICLFDKDGLEISRESFNAYFVEYPASGDVDKDGRVEMVFPVIKENYHTKTWHVFLQLWKIDAQGAVSLQWTKVIGEYSYYGDEGVRVIYPVIGDVNGDGAPEIVATEYRADGRGQRVHIISAAGKEINSFIAPQGVSPETMLIADVDGDRVGDILMSRGDKIIALHMNGSYCRGFPLTVRDSGIWMGMIVDDFDNDGKIEIAAYNTYFYALIHDVDQLLCMWDLDAPYRKDKMDWPMFRHDPGRAGFYKRR